MTVESRFPNLFIAGAARSGTTSLAKHLSQHPDVFMPKRKEPHFLASFENARYGVENQKVATKAAYLALYQKAGDAVYALDASTSALYFADVFIRNLTAFSNQPSRCLLMLRDPAQRAISHYKLLKGRGVEKRDIKTAILAPDTARYAERWGYDYTGVSRYLQGMEKIHLHFGLRNVLTLCMEDLADGKKLNGRLAEFLEIDAVNFPIEVSKENDSALWNEHPVLRWIKPSRTVRNTLRSVIPTPLYKPAKNLRLPQPSAMSSEEQEVLTALQDVYKNDVSRLEQLLNRDLSTWKNS